MARPLLTLTRKAGRIAAILACNHMSLKVYAGAFAFLLGLWGWTLANEPQDIGDWFNNIFRTIQLITLQFPTSIDKSMNVPLHIARFLLPLVAALATFHLIIGAIARPLRMALMPQTSDHIVICGVEKLTQNAVDTLAARNRDIVFLSSKVDAIRRDMLEGQGIVVVESDPADAATFESVNLSRAAALILTHDDDVKNLDLATLALDRLGKRPTAMPPLVLANIIDRETLARELDVAFDKLSRERKARYVRLSPEREGLKLELERFAPAFFRMPGETSHTLVIGLAGHWRQVLKQLVVSMQDQADRVPRLSLVLDEDEADDFNAWMKTIPDLSLVVETSVIERQKAVVVPAAAIDEWAEKGTLPHLIVLLRPEAEAIEQMLGLRAPGSDDRLKHQPILLRRVGSDHLITRLAGQAIGQSDFTNIAAFGGVVRAETIERILDNAREDLAAALHNHYLDRSEQKEAGSTEALDAWRSIPENLRHANRAAVAHLPIMLASEGLMIERTRAGECDFQPDPDMLERMARLEHQRWMADRIDLGWRAAPVRNDGRREHNCLVPFDALSPKDQQKDRDAVTTILKLLQATGARIVPRPVTVSPTIP